MFPQKRRAVDDGPQLTKKPYVPTWGVSNAARFPFRFAVNQLATAVCWKQLSSGNGYIMLVLVNDHELLQVHTIAVKDATTYEHEIIMSKGDTNAVQFPPVSKSIDALRWCLSMKEKGLLIVHPMDTAVINISV